MKLLVNGREIDYEDSMAVADLLGRLGLPTAGVAVELNKLIVKKGTYESTDLKDGDRLEIVHFVGGG